MIKRLWRVPSDSGSHVVELEHSPWTGNGPLTIDGRTVARINPLFDVPIPLGTRDVVLQPLMNGFSVYYDLLVDGRSVDTGLPAPLARRLRWRNWIAGVVLFVFFALAAAAYASWLSVVELRYERSGQLASGTVVNLREDDSENWGPSHYVGYRFSTTDGRVVDGESAVGLVAYRRVEIGATTHVQYIADDPTWNRLDGQSGWEIARWAAAVAGLIGGAALIVLVAKLSRERTERRLVTDGISAAATITAIVRRSVPADHLEIRYSYRDQEGRERRGKSWPLRPIEMEGWHAGDRCRIRYDERNPAVSVFVERVPP